VYSLYADVVVTSQDITLAEIAVVRVPVRDTLSPAGLRANFGRTHRRESVGDQSNFCFLLILQPSKGLRVAQLGPPSRHVPGRVSRIAPVIKSL
jgi:hypothetical protein